MDLIKLDKIGTDPEFLIQDFNGKLIPSFDIIEGTKDNPELIKGGYAILKDNALIEGNVPPASTKQEFIDNMKMLKELMNIKLMPYGYSIRSEDVGYFSEEDLNNKEAHIFGCSSYFNTWKGRMVRAAEIEENFRPLGFHIHISYDMLEKENPMISPAQMNEAIARAFDYFVVIPSDKVYYSPERRENYGAYGSMRDTDYGVECRSLGGYFTADEYLEWVYDQTVKAVQYASKFDNFDKLMSLQEPSEENYDFLEIKLEDQIYKTEKEKKYV